MIYRVYTEKDGTITKRCSRGSLKDAIRYVEAAIDTVEGQRVFISVRNTTNAYEHTLYQIVGGKLVRSTILPPDFQPMQCERDFERYTVFKSNTDSQYRKSMANITSLYEIAKKENYTIEKFYNMISEL